MLRSLVGSEMCIRDSGNPLWKHFQQGVVDAAREWWAAARKNSRSEYAVRSDYEPSARCLCRRSDCVFHMYVMYTSIRRCCDTCGSRKTVHWRKAGMSYGYMKNFLTAGKGATKTKDYLTNNGGSINTESDICNKCWLGFRGNAEGTKISAEHYIAVIEAQPVGLPMPRRSGVCLSHFCGMFVKGRWYPWSVAKRCYTRNASGRVQ